MKKLAVPVTLISLAILGGPAFYLLGARRGWPVAELLAVVAVTFVVFGIGVAMLWRALRK